MPQTLVAALLAEGVSIDALSGRITAFNMLDVVSASTFPAVLPRLYVVTIYETDRHPGEQDVFERVVVKTPSEADAVSSVCKLEFVIGTQTHRSVHMLSIKLEQPGRYLVQVQHSNRSDGGWSTIVSRTLLASPLPPQVSLTAADESQH